MNPIAPYLWLIPALPLAAAGLIAVTRRPYRRFAASVAIGAMVLAFFLSCGAFVQTLGEHTVRQTHNFTWFEFGQSALRLGWLLDPLTAAMIVMVTFVGTLIFIFSVGYMAHDDNFTRFFGFLSLFAAAMLGLVVANNLLLLFMCWEVVGLASYLLIGFWFHKPSAAAAAKKAFMTTRIGDVFFFLGILWLYSETGTLLFYDNGAGCLEQSAVAGMVGHLIPGGMAVSTAVSLLIFCGAIGKSGQVPLHVWLPDAMEGPTPVSALIHAATMVAAGVFLVARVYPLMAAVSPSPVAPTELRAEAAATVAVAAGGHLKSEPAGGTAAPKPPVPATHNAARVSTARQAVTWIGAITAIFAALVAVAQTDIKRILAYSTVSQLGFMFVGLGAGGVPVGIFHLITHAFFKALLFLGSGSVIHGCHEEQDIRRMGGLRKFMPVTFYTYAIGMMALSGVPIFFSGFWSKDEILHAAWLWEPSKWPFILAACGAVLTAFYMTRQMVYVFLGSYRGGAAPATVAHAHDEQAHRQLPHESPPVMTFPLGILAACAMLLGVIGTPVWPWFHGYLSGHDADVRPSVDVGVLLTMLFSSGLVAGGVWLGWRLYGRNPLPDAAEPDVLERWKPAWFHVLRNKFFVDELYEMSILRWNSAWARFCDWVDRVLLDGAVRAVSLAVLGVSWINRLIDDFVVNLGFNQACGGMRWGARLLSLWQNGQAQRYLRVIALALIVGALVFIWGGSK